MGEHQKQLNYNKLLIGDPDIMRANYSPKTFRNIILEE